MSAVFVPVAERHADVVFVDVENCGHHGGVFFLVSKLQSSMCGAVLEQPF
jgi:hypothetical protein